MNCLNLVFIVGLLYQWRWRLGLAEAQNIVVFILSLFFYLCLFNDNVGSSANVASEIWMTSDDFLDKLCNRTCRLVFKYSRSISLK